MIDHIPTQVGNNKLTPSALEVLLHYHCRPAPHPRHDAPAVASTRQSFIILGIIEPKKICGSKILESELNPNHKIFGTTPRGKKWVEALCQTTCPI